MAKQAGTSRRAFLRGMGAAATGVAASAALSGCIPLDGSGAGAGGTSQPPSDAGSTCPPTPSNTCDECPPAQQCPSPATLPSEWAQEVDVVVLGTGYAGLSAALSAADANAKVLVLEKMSKDEEGGNSKICGNMWWTPTSVDEGAKYVTALCMGLTDDACIQMLVGEMFKLNDWLSTTIHLTASPLGVFQPEYPELPGSASVRTWTNGSGAGLWQPLRDAVAARGINVLYGTPAVDLIRDPSTGEIKGVIARTGGQDINIKCKRGVVLACGGFEFGHDLQAQYLPGWPVYGQGTPGNTGDGITMAQKAGAALWHMNNALAHVGCFVPDPNDSKSIPIPIALPTECILVDKSGSRFMDERRAERHGFGHKEFLFFFDGLAQSFPRIPCYALFDENARRAGKLEGGLAGWNGAHQTYSWSADNSAEVTKGWISKGQTLDAVAAAFGAVPATLNATVTRYNGFCTAGKDQDFGRSPSTLKALTTAPYYALPIYPVMYNTQGGPRRNPKCQVITPTGEPIPRLYSAGELGSFWGWMYNGGGNAAEAVITGRLAGQNSAGESPWA